MVERIPQLSKYFQAYKNLSCPRDPLQSAAGKRKFLSEAKSHSPNKKRIFLKQLSMGPIWTIMERRRLSPVLISMMLALGLIFGTISGTVYASQSSLPNQQLYPVKILSEQVRLQLAVREEKKIALHRHFMARRVHEIYVLVRADQDVPREIFENLGDHQESILELSEQASRISGKNDPFTGQQEKQQTPPGHEKNSQDEGNDTFRPEDDSIIGSDPGNENRPEHRFPKDNQKNSGQGNTKENKDPADDSGKPDQSEQEKGKSKDKGKDKGKGNDQGKANGKGKGKDSKQGKAKGKDKGKGNNQGKGKSGK